MRIHTVNYGVEKDNYYKSLILSSSSIILITHSAILADTFIGNYWTILFGSLFVYLPGLLLIALVAKPYLLGDEFPMKALYAACKSLGVSSD